MRLQASKTEVSSSGELGYSTGAYQFKFKDATKKPTKMLALDYSTWIVLILLSIFFLSFGKYVTKDYQTLKISKTYRNPQELIDLASNFIMKNSMQMKKNLK